MREGDRERKYRKRRECVCVCERRGGDIVRPHQ